MIRVILADDHHLVRQGIRSLLEKADDIEIIAEAENGQEALTLVQELIPDVLVIDVAMPKLNGIQVIDKLQKLDLETTVVILSMHADETVIRQALQVGAKGYLPKCSVSGELLQAVRVAAQDEMYLGQSLADMDLADYSQGEDGFDETTFLDRITTREHQILDLISKSYTNKAIAKKVHLSVKTIEKHRGKLMTKLNAQDVVGLILAAVKRGLIMFDE